MKCCIVSSYPPDKCGVAIYTKMLALFLSKLIDVSVIANRVNSCEVSLDNGVRVVRCWRRNHLLYFFDIWRGILSERPDIIHIQHEYLLYGVRKYAILFPILLFMLKLIGKPIVVTMHSVIAMDKLNRQFFGIHGVGYRFPALKRAILKIFTRIIGWLSDRIIVHNDLMRRRLISDYGLRGEKIVVIPHGVSEPEGVMRGEKAKSLLGLGNHRVLLYYGFIIPGKGVETLLEAMPSILREFPDVRLVIAGCYHPRLSIENPGYIGIVERLIGELGLGDAVLFENRFIPEREVSLYISAADVIVLPYTDDSIIGASGALSRCALYGKPVIATDIPRFNQEIRDGQNGVLIKPNHPDQLREAVVYLLGNGEACRWLGQRLLQSFLDRRWERIATLHLREYRRLFGDQKDNYDS